MGKRMKQGQRRGAGFWQACVFVLLALMAARVWAQSAAPARVNPGEVTLTVDPTQSKVHWTLGSTLHTVHGTFALKGGVLRFDPASGKASGEIDADASSGQSGNGSRDKKMHNEILESARYPEVIFRPDQVKGKISAHGSCNVEVHGIFVLHGSPHELTVPVQAELSGDHWKGEAKFTVPYVRWGLKSPNTFFLKADPAVQVELELSGTMQESARP